MEEELKPKRFVSFDALLNAWKSEQTRYETIKKREGAITSLKNSLTHDNANALTFAELLKWRNEIKPPRYAARTVNVVMISGVKAVFGHAKDMQIIDEDPTRNLKRVKSSKRSIQGIPYTDQEVKSSWTRRGQKPIQL